MTTEKRIKELINQYENAMIGRYEETVILAKLRMILSLYPECAGEPETVFFDEIIKNFAYAIALQCDMLQEISDELEAERQMQCNIDAWNDAQRFMPNPVQQPMTGDFRNDKELRSCFVQYLEYQDLSVYTINDYCSRIRNVWKVFEQAAELQQLPAGLRLNPEWVTEDSPMMSAYKHVEELIDYVEIMLGKNNTEKRNWANAKAALRRLHGFANHIEG